VYRAVGKHALRFGTLLNKYNNGMETVLSTVGGGRRCDTFYATCSIEFT
jgi:hypothetical protein